MYKKIFRCLSILAVKILLEVLIYIFLKDLLEIIYLQLFNSILLIIVISILFKKNIKNLIKTPNIKNNFYGIKLITFYF